MSAGDLAAKYIRNVGRVFEEIGALDASETRLNEGKVRGVIDYARNYYEDAKFHRDQKKFEVALTSVAYCEGLLDALRLLGLVEFEWLTKE